MPIGKLRTEAARRREQFVLAYAVTGNATAAAVAAGYGVKSAKQQGAEFLSNPDIGSRARDARDAHLAEHQAAFDRQTAQLRSAGDQAILTLLKVAESAKSEMAQVQASIAILDRAGHKPIERVDSHTQHSFDPAGSDEVDSRIDRILGTASAGEGANGDSSITH